MSFPVERKRTVLPTFRVKLLLAMMMIVSGVTIVAIYAAQRHLAAEAASSLQREFHEKLSALHSVQQARRAGVTERCRALVRRPRIHAALEDNALDLLYPSARDELRDVLEEVDTFPDEASLARHAEFYRFLDIKGALLSPADGNEIGRLSREEESLLALKSVPQSPQAGYLHRKHNGRKEDSVSEILAVPIMSSETGEPIAALVLGFKPLGIVAGQVDEGVKSGILFDGKLYADGPDPAALGSLQQEVVKALSLNSSNQSSTVTVAGVPHMLFYTLLNAGSSYPPAYEVCLFPLTDLLAKQRLLGWQIISAGALMLIMGFVGSHYFSGRLSIPVEKLAVDSERNRSEREQAEEVLHHTSVELQRSARFASDASHQLKTPLAVMRAGLEELLAREPLSNDLREEISNLIHQSFRLTGVVDDLLLLSRMDAGRLQIEFAPIDLSLLLESELDDLSVQPNPLNLVIETEFPSNLFIAGEKRYTTPIVRNLLENARKYNRVEGRIRVVARQEGQAVRLCISNTGSPIPPESHGPIFERFHRGSAGENVPGHGLGLNLARELAHIHGGDLRLVRSDSQWTEFEVLFRASTLISVEKGAA